MAKKLYVGGLPYSTNEDTLRASFEKAGPVDSAAIIMDKMTGRSKGFGFVEMTNDADADKAIEMWNGQELEGRRLTVNEARPMQPRQDHPAGGSGDYGRRDGNPYWSSQNKIPRIGGFYFGMIEILTFDFF